MINWLKELLSGGEARSSVDGNKPMTNDNYENVEDEYKRANGKKEARILEKEDKIQQLQKQAKGYKQRANRLANELEKAKKLKDAKQTPDSPVLSLREFFRLTQEAEQGRDVLVLARDHTPLGFFHDIHFERVQGGTSYQWHIIVRDERGRKQSVMDHQNIAAMIHRVVGFVNVLDAEVMVLNRHPDSRKLVPDTKITSGGETKPAEKKFEEMKAKIDELQSKVREKEKLATQEQQQKEKEQLQRIAKEEEVKALRQQVSNNLIDIQQFSDEFYDIYEEKHRLESSNNMLQKRMHTMQDEIDKYSAKIDEYAGLTKMERATDHIIDINDAIADAEARRNAGNQTQQPQ